MAEPPARVLSEDATERLAIEAQVGYAVCGINGCVLMDRHAGQCVFPEVSARKRKTVDLQLNLDAPQHATSDKPREKSAKTKPPPASKPAKPAAAKKTEGAKKKKRPSSSGGSSGGGGGSKNKAAPAAPAGGGEGGKAKGGQARVSIPMEEEDDDDDDDEAPTVLESREADEEEEEDDVEDDESRPNLLMVGKGGKAKVAKVTKVAKASAKGATGGAGGKAKDAGGGKLKRDDASGGAAGDRLVDEDDDEDDEQGMPAAASTSTKPSSSSAAAEEEEEDDDDDDGEACIKCGLTSDGARMLLCDGPGFDGSGCETACHFYCCEPPMTAAPAGDWFCTVCTKRKAEGRGQSKVSGSGSSAKFVLGAKKERPKANNKLSKPEARANTSEGSGAKKASAAGGGGSAKAESSAARSAVPPPPPKAAAQAPSAAAEPLTATERREAAEAAAEMCEKLEEAMEALMGVTEFASGAEVLLSTLEMCADGATGAAAVATPDCQRTLGGALQCARRQVNAPRRTSAPRFSPLSSTLALHPRP